MLAAPRLHRVAVSTAVATLGLMIVGSVVHGTGSSLACPDWPLCHGTAFPRMTDGVQFEHSHRLVAAGVIILAVVLLVGAWRTGDRVARRLATAAVALVGVQATLGGLTVLLGLPPAVSIAHLATSMSFLSIVVLLAVRLMPDRVTALEPRVRRVRRWIGFAALLVFAQVVLGGAVRHLGGALACPSMPLCSGIAWPSGMAQWVQMAHRALGATAAVATLVTCGMAVSRFRGRTNRFVAALPAALIVVQLALGVGLVLTGAPLWLITVHHATGALTLASLVLAWAMAGGRIWADFRHLPDGARALPSSS